MTPKDSPRKPASVRCRCVCAGVRLAALLSLTGAVAGYSQSVPATPSPSVQHSITVKSELVVLPVRVIDGDGDTVSGLSREQFRVYVDRQQQRISLFEQEDTPVTVGLVIDHSQSMGPKLGEVATAILSFAHSSNAQDEMFVVNFNENVSLELFGGKPFTHDATELESAIRSVSAAGQTALYDAVIEGLDHLQLAHRDKKALIVVSDGGDNASKHKYADVLTLARQSQTVIYSIGLVGAPTQEEQDRRVLQRLSDDTGGIAFFPDATQSVAAISARIAHALREQYTLGFVPAEADNSHSFRKIKVKVSAPGRGKIRVQTRLGYSVSEVPARRETHAP